MGIASDIFGTEITQTAESAMGEIVTYLVYGFIICAIFIGVFIWYRNKSIFKWKVRVFNRRENGKIKEGNLQGGYLKNKQGIPFFRIKLNPKKPWQKIDLYVLPDASMIDEDDRVYYNRIDPFTFIQCKREFSSRIVQKRTIELLQDHNDHVKGTRGKLPIEEAQLLVDHKIAKFANKDIEDEAVQDVTIEPVRNDIKAITVNDIQQVRDTLTNSVREQAIIFTAGLIILGVVLLIAYYILANKFG